MNFSRLVFLAALLPAACEAPPEPPHPESASSDQEEISTTEIIVFFTREERPQPVTREGPVGTDVLTLALEMLLQGPTDTERREGLSSWFSEETSNLLIDATVDEEGHAVIDFADIGRVIPGASSSAGSEILLAELTGTVAQFESVRTVEFQLEGSCHRFWMFLQRGCEILDLND